MAQDQPGTDPHLISLSDRAFVETRGIVVYRLSGRAFAQGNLGPYWRPTVQSDSAFISFLYSVHEQAKHSLHRRRLNIDHRFLVTVNKTSFYTAPSLPFSLASNLQLP